MKAVELSETEEDEPQNLSHFCHIHCEGPTLYSDEISCTNPNCWYYTTKEQEKKLDTINNNIDKIVKLKKKASKSSGTPSTPLTLKSGQKFSPSSFYGKQTKQTNLNKTFGGLNREDFMSSDELSSSISKPIPVITEEQLDLEAKRRTLLVKATKPREPERRMVPVPSVYDFPGRESFEIG